MLRWWLAAREWVRDWSVTDIQPHVRWWSAVSWHVGGGPQMVGGGARYNWLTASFTILKLFLWMCPAKKLNMKLFHQSQLGKNDNCYQKTIWFRSEGSSSQELNCTKLQFDIVPRLIWRLEAAWWVSMTDSDEWLVLGQAGLVSIVWTMCCTMAAWQGGKFCPVGHTETREPASRKQVCLRPTRGGGIS